MGIRKDKNVQIKRFGPYRIVEHWVNAILFGVLVLTGLPQKFHNYELSQWIILGMGGIESVRMIHRVCGLCLTLLLAQHIVTATLGVLLYKWRPSIFINEKDFQDNLQNLRYYLKLRKTPASCDRFDYRQKFEYWGVVVGGLLMGATGLTLWFPTIVARFVPAMVVPNARALHTNEAMLAFLVIIIWHMYHAIFSPEVFPLDTVMFTGKISRKRMVHEHPLELARMEGKSLEEIVGPEPEQGRYAPHGKEALQPGPCLVKKEIEE